MLQCNECSNKKCTLIHSHWGNDPNKPWPEPRTMHKIMKYGLRRCSSWIPVGRKKGLSTMFEIAILNNPQGVYDMLTEVQMKVGNRWTKGRYHKRA